MTPPPSPPPPPPPTATAQQLQEARAAAILGLFFASENPKDFNQAMFLALFALRNEEQGLGPAVQLQMTQEFVRAIGLGGLQTAADIGGVSVPK